MHCDLKALCDEVSCEALALDVSTGAGPFILFRLLVMMPWSARAAEGDLSLYAAAVIGALLTRAECLTGFGAHLLTRGVTGASAGAGGSAMPGALPVRYKTRQWMAELPDAVCSDSAA